ncbi:hypothetical protein GGR42_002410 [Saonia flava]|uniref:Uncharacterized protein n=1 Tax=Saonia flava TaxID=523696 RepID=A0A846QVC2_9FLAO|nr:hypothetical protein [Saonia flava]NJB71948.1 hypothetical protein [Saonia flava]
MKKIAFITQKPMSGIFSVTVLIFTFFFFSGITNLVAQNNKKDVYVDSKGVMHWGDTKKEVKGFGVNYSTPFAHVYRSAKRMGIDPKEAMDNDVYHLSRLGFDLYRIHVWDTEISDTLGNLIENQNLDMFDYLLKKLKDKGFNFMITPIAFWGNGWPEPDDETPGFSHKYGKGDCLHNPDAIKAQHNYLEQFLNHVNPYTGVAYKDEPNMIAFEISNEPHHRGDAEKVTDFVSGMVQAMRKTGLKKPIFYNISHGVHFANAYFNAGIQGGTFQWYPTGLGYQRELPGNSLPNVNDYDITFDETIKKHQAAKLVYEFDAADVGRSYIYPVMARSFREAGIQIATHFAYDPTFLGHVNTEYNTHYMNLAYTPQKALSLMISSEVFHEIPMYSNFGTYPLNLTFDNFSVSYSKDLAQYNSPEKFIYTNSTISLPANERKLKTIAGYGNSSVVKYDGLGSYFLDKIEKGLWRLEVMPDAVWVDNPFGRNSPKKTVGVIKWAPHTMKISLKDLGDDFSITPINKDNSYLPKIENSRFTIQPGTYVLRSPWNTNKKWSADDTFKYNKLGDFYAPKTNITDPWFKHEPPKSVVEKNPLTLTAQYIAPQEPIQIQLFMGGFGNDPIDMESNGDYTYSATIPADQINAGYFNYNIIVKTDEGSYMTYPAGKEGRLFDWDYFDRDPYEITVKPKEHPITLFNAKTDVDVLVRPWRSGFKLVPTTRSGVAEYEMNIEQLFIPDNENLNAQPIYDYSFKHFVINELKANKENLDNKKHLVLHGKSLNNKACKLQIAMVLTDGSAHGKTIEIKPNVDDYSISLSELKPVKTVTLPRPYPSFLPYYLVHNINSSFDIHEVESLQFSIGPGIPENELQDKHGIAITSVRLE